MFFGVRAAKDHQAGIELDGVAVRTDPMQHLQKNERCLTIAFDRLIQLLEGPSSASFSSLNHHFVKLSYQKNHWSRACRVHYRLTHNIYAPLLLGMDDFRYKIAWQRLYGRHVRKALPYYSRELQPPLVGFSVYNSEGVQLWRPGKRLQLSVKAEFGQFAVGQFNGLRLLTSPTEGSSLDTHEICCIVAWPTEIVAGFTNGTAHKWLSDGRRGPQLQPNHQGEIRLAEFPGSKFLIMNQHGVVRLEKPECTRLVEVGAHESTLRELVGAELAQNNPPPASGFRSWFERW